MKIEALVTFCVKYIQPIFHPCYILCKVYSTYLSRLPEYLANYGKLAVFAIVYPGLPEFTRVDQANSGKL